MLIKRVIFLNILFFLFFLISFIRSYSALADCYGATCISTCDYCYYAGSCPENYTQTGIGRSALGNCLVFSHLDSNGYYVYDQYICGADWIDCQNPSLETSKFCQTPNLSVINDGITSVNPLDTSLLGCWLKDYCGPNPCGGSLPTPTLSPTPTPYPCTNIFGYVKTPSGAGIEGATINITKSDNPACTGGVCSSVTSRSDGSWSATCQGEVACLRVIETANNPNYEDSTQYPTGPCGWPDCEPWDFNTFVIKNPTTQSCGPITFYDVLKSGVTITPTPTRTPSSAWFQLENCDFYSENNI